MSHRATQKRALSFTEEVERTDEAERKRTKLGRDVGGVSVFLVMVTGYEGWRMALLPFAVHEDTHHGLVFPKVCSSVPCILAAGTVELF